METEVLLFFEKHQGALPLYEKLEGKIREEIPFVTRKVQKTQITFYKERLFACVSFLKVKKGEKLPEPYMTVTFGLEHKADSPRIEIATEPYPNRWTHHIVVRQESDINEELMDWLKEAAAFAQAKKKRKG